MKKIIIVMAMTLLAIAIPRAISAQTAASTDNGQQEMEMQPKAHLRLDSLYINMGLIKRDSVGTAIMHFRNTGDAPLQILRIFSECGCTVPSYSSDEVMPGDEGEIKIRFKSKGRQPGPFRKALRIRSNADNPREVLIVKGRILSD